MNGLLVGCKGAWLMERTPPDGIPDQSGNGNDIGALSGVTWSSVTGKNNLSLSQGTDISNRAGIVAPTDMHVTGSFTVNFYIRRAAGEWSDGNTDPIIGVWDDTTGKNWYVIWNATAAVMQLGLSEFGTAEVGVVAQGPAGQPTADVFHMVTAGYDQALGELFLYFNGGSRNTASYSGNIFGASTAPFTVANMTFSGTRVCSGRHDEISFWDRALVDADVANLDNGGAGLFFDDFDSGEDSEEQCARYYQYRRRLRV